MSIKKYFDVASNIKSLAGTTAQKISSQVESVGYHEQEIIKEERYIPHADYSVPQGFARYGNAKDYYTQAIQRIYNTFPYDGSLKERLEWENESTYLDLYIYNDRYPRTNGYINFAAGGWGTPSALTANGYGIPASSANYEYIYVKGGPNQNPNGTAPYRAQFTGSNYYEPSKNRTSNFALNVNSRGVSLEFWLKKKAFDDAKTQKEVIFDLWNGVTASATNYARLRLELTSATGRRAGLAVGESPFLLTLYSGSTGFFQQRIATTTLTTTGSVADNLWHHYAVTVKQDSAITTRFYVDGRLNLEQHVSASGKGTLENISGLDLRANIGALITQPSRRSAKPTTAVAYAGKLSASLDEFRFWKTERTGQEIGRFWFTQVGGGVNTDPEPFIETEVSANLDLGVYFKFNEGITNTASVDSTVLDYSGRFSNGAWTCPAITAGNFALARNTGSAIVLSNAATLEYKDPIIYPQHASVKSLTTVLEATGSTYDVNNNASIYNTLPSWIIEEDNDGDGELRKLTQIISSYFDTLHLQIKDLNTIKDVGYVSGSNKPLPFAERLLNSAGLVSPEIFLDADVLNVLASRSEDKVFEKPLEEIKNIIYKNIYNNLVYIFKSKGTEKSFRNLIRCFGIDDELVKLNMYANNVQFELRNNRRNVAVADRFVNFNTGDNKSGVVYNYRDPSNSQSAGYLSASAALANGHAITLESEILFPLKSVPADDVYIDTNTISSSLFGVHGVQAVHAASSPSHTTWATNDIVNFQVYAVRDEVASDNVRFVVTSSSPRGKVPYLTSELYEDVYNNTRWNLALRIKPEKYPLTSLVQGAELDPSRTTGSYTVELHGVQGDSGEILQEFTVSKTIIAPLHFITGSRRVYVGAHRTNFTGSRLAPSDVKINACRFWLDYVDNEALAGHILDTQNFGTTHPHWFAYPFNPSSSYGDIQKADTLVFNWEFLTNTGSNAAGRFTVPDLTSGSLIASTNALTASYGALGKIINPQYTARGDLFATSSTTAIDKDFVISSKLNLPENLKSEEMIQVLNATDQDVFTPDSRPTNYSFAFEKSMYQVISEEMINYFATLSDFHNLIGDPVNQWRPEYKSIDFMRQKFFETVENKELDFDKFYQYYKWFDSSLSVLLAQLAPVSADVATDVRTVIENHILERPKYQRKFPFLAKSDTNYPTGRIDGGMAADKTAQASPDEFPAGTSFFTNTAFTRRQIGSSNTPRTRPWKHFHAPRVDTNTPLAKSFLFDGTDEYVDIGSVGTWEALIGGAAGLAKEYSVSLWFKPAALVSANPYIYGFGARDRNLFIYGASLGAAKLHASNRSNSQNLAQTATGVLTAGTWHHLTVTFGGANDGLTTIYINGADATATQDITSNPESILTSTSRIGTAAGGAYTAGNFCDFAVWDKELSSAEVTEIYGDAQRVNLKEVSVTSNLIAWWMLGADPRDTYNGTIYDQIGTLNGTPTNFDSAADIELDSPVFKIPYYGSTGVNKNMYWHRYMELSALTGSKLTSRSKLYQSISQSFYRRTNSPVKFGVEGTTAVAGVGKHHNAVVNYVFSAARAWTGKKLVSSGSTVEQLIPTTDVYYPSLKQRLGFGVSGSANEAVSGPRHAPFSLYSSSVTTGYNAEVVANYASGVLITNLHNDFVVDTDVPMQGPFPEKYVGGRFYRHTALNKGTDTELTRGEGFRINFDNGGSQDIAGVNNKSLVILPPDSPHGVQNTNLPTAYRFREVTTKRPVNIKNIQMRTGSTIIGNYEKNYQVVNSNSRMKNDPFFNDQSFNFALYPETLATRGRFPLYEPEPVEAKSILFDASLGTRVYDTDDTAWEDTLSGVYVNGLTISFWFNYTGSPLTTPRLVNLGTIQSGIFSFDGFSMRLYFDDPDWVFYAELRDSTAAASYAQGSTSLAADTWYHAIIEFPAGALDGTDSEVPRIYLNNSLEVLAGSDGAADWTGFSDLDSGISLGDHPSLSDPYNGYLCDVAIINKTISSAERALLYNDGKRTNIALDGLTANLAAYYRLGNKSVQGNADSTTGDIYNSVIDNDIPNPTPRYFTNTATNGIKGQSPSTLSPESDWPALYGPLQKPTANPGGNLNFLVPMRTGSDSQDNIIVNRYAGSGYEVMSLGYMDPAHEELSVYNALPYHNLKIRNYGLSGNVAPDPLAAKTITVIDQIDKNRGLDQRASLHCGPFGSDAAFGSVPELTYVTTPSWHKTNRNAIHGVKEITRCTGEFDGADSRVDIGTAPVWDDLIGGSGTAAKPFTLSAWIYARSDGEAGYGRIFSFAATDRQLVWVGTDNRVQLYIDGATPGYEKTFNTLALDRWYHIVGVYSGGNNGTITMYVDGSKQRPWAFTYVDAPVAISSQDCFIGNDHTTTKTWDGYIQNCGIWDRALGSGEVASLYNGGIIAPLDINEKSLYSAPMLTKGLVGYYRFNSGLGDTTTSIPNRAPDAAASTDGVGTTLTLVTDVGPTTVTPDTTYDNLFVQHQIPRSTQQYAWVTSSLNYGERIYGFPPPGVLSGTVLSQLFTASAFPFYGADYNTNLAHYGGRLTCGDTSVDIQSRSSSPHFGAYCGLFEPGLSLNAPTEARVTIGAAATWEALIGGSSGSALPFTLSAWVYLRSSGGGQYGRILSFSDNDRALYRTTGNAFLFRIDGTSAGADGKVESDTHSLRSTNGWTHVVATFAGGDPGGSSTANYMKLYVNGEEQTNVSQELNKPMPIGIDECMIGNRAGLVGTGERYNRSWDGRITDVAVWSAALTARQAKTLYNKGDLIDIQAKLPTNLVAWYRFNPWLGDTFRDTQVGNSYSFPPQLAISSNGSVRNVVGTAGTNGTSYAVRPLQDSPFIVDQFTGYINNQVAPYGWPTWKQTRVGETPVARALRKQNYIGQVVPPADVPKLIRNPQGSMVEVGTEPAKSPNTAVLYYESPIDSKMGPVDFFFEDNTEDSDVANNMRVQLPYGNSLEYFSNDGLNSRLGLTIDLDKPMIFDTVRDFLVASSLSTVVRYTESMYPSAHNMYRARVRGRPNYNINKIWNSDRATRSTLGGLTGSFAVPPQMATQGKATYSISRTGSNSSIWPLDAHNNFATTSSVVPWDGAGQLMNSYSRYSGSSRATGLSGTLTQFGKQAPAPTYTVRVPTGRTSGTGQAFPILAGDAKWTAATEAGKDPYQNYSTWGERASTAMKDGSIIPEFRISQHLRAYYDTHAGNFLTDNITGIYEISGATIPNSSINGFFKTYSNSDFMKYFRVIDSSLNDQRSGDLKIERDRIKLSAQGLIKFLPYKGFYPAERTAEIATIFSQSYGSSIIKGAWRAPNNAISYSPREASRPANSYFRIFAEPMMAPGILFNTIKSGLAVGSAVLLNTASYWVMQPHSEKMTGLGVFAQCHEPTALPEQKIRGMAYPEGTLYYEELLTLGTGSANGNGVGTTGTKGSMGYHIAKVPFEAVQDPSTFFNMHNLLEVGRTRAVLGDNGYSNSVANMHLTRGAFLYDTAVPGSTAGLPGSHKRPPGSVFTKSGQLPALMFTQGPYVPDDVKGDNPRVILTDPDGGYRYAIDNFLCETTNFFMNGITSLRSNREEQFQTVQEGAVYTTTFKLYRSSRYAEDASRWDMYSRASGFGFPLGTMVTGGFANGSYPLGKPVVPTFSHHLPPYYSGQATATLIYTASYTGKPTVDEILSELKISYHRDETIPNYSASVACPNPGVSPLIPPTDKTGGRYNDPRMQIDSSFNMKEKIQEVPKGTNQQANYWMIQSKFETPILNFANVTQSSTPGPRRGAASDGSGLITQGWHPDSPYTFTGATVQTSSANLVVQGMWHQYGSPITSSTAGVFVEITDEGSSGNSLADVVGFQKGITVRVGDPKKNAILEEAVVVVPFRVNNDQREFFSYTGTARETTNYANVEVAMKKYVFPPKFDFVRTSAALEAAQERLNDLIAASATRAAVTVSGKRRLALQNAVNKAANEASLVQPVLMYVFEFGVEIDEKDIADMWQNLPPSIDEKMQSSTEVIIEDRELLRVMAANNEDIQWMVFKVKKRAKRDFDVYKRSLVTTDTAALAPKLRGAYTYNWPYDYFSLVELATIDATVQWTSGDMQYELEYDESIVLDGRPPLRGTRGAPVVPTPTMVHRPGMTTMGAAVGPPGKNMKTKPSSRSARKQAAKKKSSKKAANRSARVRRPTASPAQSRRRRQSTRDPANRSTRNNRSRRNRGGRGGRGNGGRGSGGRGSGRGGNY